MRIRTPTGVITNDGLFHHVAVTFVKGSNTVVLYIDRAGNGDGTLNVPADVAGHVIKVERTPGGTLLPRPAGRVPGLQPNTFAERDSHRDEHSNCRAAGASHGAFVLSHSDSPITARPC
jgi:hypothetical protein